jgi:tRNA1(Val) A37 N6-methylase TrmN6
MEKPFDYVISNPLYFEKDKTTPSPQKVKIVSHTETTASLEDWVRFIYLWRPRGTVLLFYRSDRL